MFKLHSIESAPEESKPLLENAQQTMGMIPNLFAVLAESPQALQAYNQLHQLFTQSSLNAEELTVVWQTINVEHQCHYCVPAHTAIAAQMGVDPNLVKAIRSGEPLADKKLQTLRETTLELIRNRGRLSPQQTEKFVAAGYGSRQLLDIILGIAQKTISNYTNHLAETPVDEVFKPFV
jgi:alkylhydroperoxidase family enzyme